MPTVKFTLDPKNPQKMSKAERARFDAIRDEDIDYSDIPELGADFWATAKIEKPGQKPSVTMRMDKATLAYFKRSDPKGYTGKMAAVLKAYVRAHQPKQVPKLPRHGIHLCNQAVVRLTLSFIINMRT